MKVSITGLNHCLPEARLGNSELVERFGEKSLKTISKMSGIVERRVVTEGVTAVDLGYQAAVRLMSAHDIDPATIDAIIFTSQTGDYKIPASSCLLHGRLELEETCAAFDIGLGCSGYPYSLMVAKGLILAGSASRVLLLSADALTTLIHPQDRALVSLHGDGAAATILEASSDERSGIIGIDVGTDGSGADNLIVPAGGARCPSSEQTRVEETDESGCTRTAEHLYMNGPAVFHFSVYKVPDVITSAVEKFGLALDDFDLIVLHQANRTMLDLIYKRLHIPEEKRYYYHAEVGNLSGASTPVTLSEALRSGRIKPGSRTLVVSFGVGLSWGVVAIQWPEVLPAPVAGAVDYVMTKRV